MMSVEFALKYISERCLSLTTDPSGTRLKCIEEAEQGSMIAQCVASTLFWNGLGGPADIKAARYWCEKAAAAGSKDARYALANQTIATGDAEQAAQSVKVLRSLVEDGHLPSMIALSLLMFTGERGLVGQNVAEALDMLVEPAEQGSSFAQCLLGAELITRDDKQSRRAGAKWLEAAASSDSAMAHRYLSSFYQNGAHGYPKDPDRARFHGERADELERRSQL